MMKTRTTIALASANEAAIAAASVQLLETATRRGVQLVLLQGVKTALEADAVYRDGGELWALGEDTGEAFPELAVLADRTIDDSTNELLAAGLDQALDEFLGKTRIAA